MDNHENTEPTTLQPLKPTEPKKMKHMPKLMFGCIVLVILIVAVAGVYEWQHKKVTDLDTQLSSTQTQVANLQKQVSITSQKTSATPTQAQSSTFTYSPQTGGFNLTLPKTYEVLVGADGNDGGAPGFDFKVVPLDDTNVSTDQYWTDEAEIQTGDSQSLSAAVSSEESQMQQNGDCSTLGSGSCDTTDFSTSDTTVGGQPAKLITAKAGSEYQGYVNVYVVVYGNWGYVITSNNVSTSASSSTPNVPGTLLAAILKGVSLKVAKAE
jgi:cell division protein FtsL